jgi:hypothetical protein
MLSLTLEACDTGRVLHGAHTACCRALRTQQFLAFTAADLANRDAKQKALLQEFEASRKGKLVSKAELDDFYQRLQVTEASLLALHCAAAGVTCHALHMHTRCRRAACSCHHQQRDSGCIHAPTGLPCTHVAYTEGTIVGLVQHLKQHCNTTHSLGLNDVCMCAAG